MPLLEHRSGAHYHAKAESVVGPFTMFRAHAMTTKRLPFGNRQSPPYAKIDKGIKTARADSIGERI